jgi:transcriptional regulator with XRE-family HTH domain
MLTFYQMVGQRILERLNELGWTQLKLAEQLNLSKQVMNKIIRGEKNTTILEIREIATTLNVPLEQLLAPVEEAKYPVEEKEEEFAPIFMGRVTSDAGKNGMERATNVIKMLLEYEDTYKTNKELRNEIVNFKGIQKVRDFSPQS